MRGIKGARELLHEERRTHCQWIWSGGSVNHQLEEGNNYERVYRVAFVEQVCFTPSVSDLKPAGQPYVPCPEDARDKQGDNAR